MCIECVVGGFHFRLGRHSVIERIMALSNPKQCKKLAERLKDKEHIFLLGKGYGEPIALEGALKLKVRFFFFF